jgi:hypothetical protein
LHSRCCCCWSLWCQWCWRYRAGRGSGKPARHVEAMVCTAGVYACVLLCAV